jgi:hypothetical protein
MSLFRSSRTFLLRRGDKIGTELGWTSPASKYWVHRQHLPPPGSSMSPIPQVVVLKDQLNKKAHTNSAHLACETAGSIRTVAALSNTQSCLQVKSRLRRLEDALVKTTRIEDARAAISQEQEVLEGLSSVDPTLAENGSAHLHYLLNYWATDTL